MKRFTIVGICLVAVLALSAMVAGSASAAFPEYKTCIKAAVKNTGNYSEKTCSTASKVAGTGKYERAEWDKGKKTSTKGKNVGTPKNNIVNPLPGLEACIIEGVTEDGETEAEAKKTSIGESTEPGKMKARPNARKKRSPVQ